VFETLSAEMLIPKLNVFWTFAKRKYFRRQRAKAFAKALMSATLAQIVCYAAPFPFLQLA